MLRETRVAAVVSRRRRSCRGGSAPLRSVSVLVAERADGHMAGDKPIPLRSASHTAVAAVAAERAAVSAAAAQRTAEEAHTH
jgi:hypothetical protein